jgi:hypothetical protein
MVRRQRNTHIAEKARRRSVLCPIREHVVGLRVQTDSALGEVLDEVDGLLLRQSSARKVVCGVNLPVSKPCASGP